MLYSRYIITILVKTPRFETPFYLFRVYLTILNSKTLKHFIYMYAVVVLLSFILADTKTNAAFQFLPGAPVAQ